MAFKCEVVVELFALLHFGNLKENFVQKSEESILAKAKFLNLLVAGSDTPVFFIHFCYPVAL